jgi:hypothetical protein
MWSLRDKLLKRNRHSVNARGFLRTRRIKDLQTSLRNFTLFLLFFPHYLLEIILWKVHIVYAWKKSHYPERSFLIWKK